MNTPEINQLLDRYFEGNTTLEEEAWLREALQNADPNTADERVKALFAYWETERGLTYIGEPFMPPAPKLRPLRKVLKWSVAAAAVVLLALAGARWMQPEQATVVLSEEKDQEEALKKTREALLLLSTHLNHGEEKMKTLSTFYQSENKIKKQAQP